MSLTYAGSDLNRDRQFAYDYSLYADATLSPGFTSTYYSCYVSYFGACEDPSIIYTSDQVYDRTNHEIRLVSNQDSRFRWLAGIFYEDATHSFDGEWHVLGTAGLVGDGSFGGDLNGDPVRAALEPPDIYWTTDQTRSNKETAIFGEVSFDFTEKLSMAYSARYFDFDSSLVGFSGTFWWPSPQFGERGEAGGPNPNTNLSTNDSDIVSKFNVTYLINDDVMVFASWSEGYRPGGLNRVYNTEIGGVYQPDFLTSIEIGVKMTLLDGRMRFNAALFTQSWDNFQLSKIDTSVSVLTLTDNVGNAESSGIEFDGSFLITDSWDMNFGLSYIDSTLSDDYWLRAADEGVTPPEAPAGTELPRVPNLKWNITSRYTFDVRGKQAFIQGNYVYTGESYNLLYGTSVTRTRDKQEAYKILNLAIGVDMGSWATELFVKNATDERGQVFINGFSYDSRITTNRPRTVGVRFRMRFD
jgi:outer membrane receptor protein involved in Fe transport